MLLPSFQQFVVSSALSRVKIGIKLDNRQQAREKKNWKEIKKIDKELLGYQNYAINGTGERGVGKTEGTIEACNMAGLPVLLLYPSQWVDNSDAVGMPKVRLYNGKEVTINIIRDFFPRIKTDEKGNKMVRKDGGYMIDFESVSEYIANYEEMMIYYEGDINQAPGLVVFWDEINRVVVQDVQQLMFSVMLNQKLGNYSFPNGTLFVSASNPNTGDYSVSALMEEEAFKDRFVQVPVENNLKVSNIYMASQNYHWSVIALANQHPETVTPVGEHYDLEVKPSNRSMKTLSSIQNFTTVEQDLEPGDFQEVVAGIVGDKYAAAYATILEKGPELIPSGEEIITNYDKYHPLMEKAKETGRQDIVNQVKENFLQIMREPDVIDKYSMRATKNEDGTVDIPPNLDNVYKFFLDVPAEFRITLITEFVKHPKVHPAIALHKDLYELVEKDIIESNRRGKATIGVAN